MQMLLIHFEKLSCWILVNIFIFAKKLHGPTKPFYAILPMILATSLQIPILTKLIL
jgi:hypothetical protein